MSDETAKAVQEVAKASVKFAEVTEKVGGFVAKVIGPASNQVGGILEDWTRYYRYKNLLKIADKVEAIHARRKIEGKTISIPPRIAIPMLESAALEDDETLQEVWARLIANSTDPNFKESAHPGFIEIIRQLSSDEAIILTSFLQMEKYPILFTNLVVHDPSKIHKVEPPSLYQLIYEQFKTWCEFLGLKQPNNLRAYLDNLQRLQIIELENISSSKLADGLASAIGPKLISERGEYLKMTAYGKNFIAVCISDKK
jgi:hypothetical protein